MDRVIRLLQEIEDSLKVAERILSLDLDEFISDARNRYTLRLCIIEIVEAAVAIGLHILREQFREEAEGIVQTFRKLVERGVVSVDVGEDMMKLTKLRNLIVHRYWEVDDVRLYREVKEEGVKLIRRFIGEVKGYVSGRV